ncbi:transcription initiation factor TFIID subunit 12 [Teleopsis dalmanni]|uniref:transcription initiation factor TFIID subunit 12 n=1 Tax=Teleopsis dalmanni TaxID=139649 RepID=UPI0018CDC692|nr:transcription initiation factor TFIID subunit 12 [Teleopsis dalmanni]
MNMIMDNSHHQHQHTIPLVQNSPTRANLHVSTTPPTPLSPAHNNNNDTAISPHTSPVGKTTLKRSFDVAFLMMPDERIKQKQAEKQARLSEIILERHQYPTDLSPRSQQLLQQQQQLHHLHEQNEIVNFQEARRYAQITLRSPRIYDDPTVVIPTVNSTTPEPEALPMKSAFTKVASTRLESPIQPAPPLSPDQLSCPSMSPPMSTTPPRTNSDNGRLSNGSANSISPCLNPNIVYQNFRADYQFNGPFQSVNQVQALQAQRLKQQFLYRPPMNVTSAPNSNTISMSGGPVNAPSPPDFLPGYAAFPFPPTAATHPFAAVAPPELPRIVQNPAAAAILSTLIPPTLASTFTLTAQNVCAKCNISFRMTSDLVYHMRSHHKSEVATDPNRRKREEKLKCPVCQESFRERHHLTRHMTAHQDKESDQNPIANGTHNNNNELLNMNSNNGRHHMSRISSASK